MKDKSSEKILIEKTIFRKQGSNPFTWKDIKHIVFEDDDVIKIGYDEGFYSENNSWDPHFYVEVIRMVIETDKQFEERQSSNKWEAKWLRERTFNHYKDLIKKFEGCCNYCGSPDGNCTDVEAETCENHPKK